MTTAAMNRTRTRSRTEADSETFPPESVSIVERLAYHRAAVAALEQQQRQELVAAIVAVVGCGCVFSARELWQHAAVSPELANAFANSGIRSPRVLGKRLKAMSNQGRPSTLIARIGADEHGALWCCR